MSFLAVLLALLLEQGLRHLEPLRGPRWFHAYYEAFAPFTRNADPTRAALMALAIVLTPTVIVLFLGSLLEQVSRGEPFDSLFQVVVLLLQAAVLLFCLGPKD